MVEQKECERLGLGVKKRKNGENHDRCNALGQATMRGMVRYERSVIVIASSATICNYKYQGKGDERLHLNRHEGEREDRMQGAAHVHRVLDTGGKGLWKQVGTCQEH